MVEQKERTDRDPKTGRFLPGNRANPGGRPKGSVSLTTLLRNRLAKNPHEAEEIVNALIALCKGKELGALKEAFDRIDGKPTETQKIEGEMPIKLVFVPAQELGMGQDAQLLEDGRTVEGEAREITEGE
jgi:hypothetical protein